MTQKDYILIAGILMECRALEPKVDHDTLDKVAKRLGYALMADNPRFVLTKFLRASGVE